MRGEIAQKIEKIQNQHYQEANLGHIASAELTPESNAVDAYLTSIKPRKPRKPKSIDLASLKENQIKYISPDVAIMKFNGQPIILNEDKIALTKEFYLFCTNNNISRMEGMEELVERKELKKGITSLLSSLRKDNPNISPEILLNNTFQEYVINSIDIWDADETMSSYDDLITDIKERLEGTNEKHIPYVADRTDTKTGQLMMKLLEVEDQKLAAQKNVETNVRNMNDIIYSLSKKQSNLKTDIAKDLINQHPEYEKDIENMLDSPIIGGQIDKLSLVTNKTLSDFVESFYLGEHKVYIKGSKLPELLRVGYTYANKVWTDTTKKILRPITAKPIGVWTNKNAGISMNYDVNDITHLEKEDVQAYLRLKNKAIGYALNKVNKLNKTETNLYTLANDPFVVDMFNRALEINVNHAESFKNNPTPILYTIDKIREGLNKGGLKDFSKVILPFYQAKITEAESGHSRIVNGNNDAKIDNIHGPFRGVVDYDMISGKTTPEIILSKQGMDNPLFYTQLFACFDEYIAQNEFGLNIDYSSREINEMANKIGLLTIMQEAKHGAFFAKKGRMYEAEESLIKAQKRINSKDEFYRIIS